MNQKDFKERAQALMEQGKQQAKEWANRLIGVHEGEVAEKIRQIAENSFSNGYQKGVFEALGVFRDLLDKEIAKRAERAN